MEKAVNNVLPQPTPLSSSWEKANCGGFFSSNLRDPIKERGEELDVRARVLPKQLHLRVPPSRGLSPDANSTNRAFQRHPKTAPTSHRHPVGRGNPSSRGKAGERRVLLGGRSEQRGSPRGWKVLRGGPSTSASPLCQRGTKQAGSRSCPQPSARERPKNRFPVYPVRNRSRGRGHLGLFLQAPALLPPDPQRPGEHCPTAAPISASGRGCHRGEVAQGWRGVAGH